MPPPPPPCRPRSWWAALRTCEGVATTRLCLVWDELLAQRGQLPSRERKAELPSERRGWAFDLPPGGGTTANAPKRWVAADVDAFIDVYMELGPLERHAYELLEATRSCHLFFDLDGRSDGKLKCDEAARCIAEEAASTCHPKFRIQIPKANLSPSLVKCCENTEFKRAALISKPKSRVGAPWGKRG